MMQPTTETYDRGAPAAARALPTNRSTEADHSAPSHIFEGVRHWFSEPNHDRALEVLTFLCAEHTGVPHSELIDKFNELKMLAGDGFQGHFIQSNYVRFTQYEIDFGGAQGSNFRLQVPVADRSHRTGMFNLPALAVSSSIAGVLVASYLFPNFRAQVINNACEEASGFVNCSYDSALGWKEFALSVDPGEKVANMLNYAAACLINAANSVRLLSGLSLDVDAVYHAAAKAPVWAVKTGISIACWQLQLNVTRYTWGCIRGYLVPPEAPAAIPASPSSTGVPVATALTVPARTATSVFHNMLDSAGIYFSSAPVLRAKAFVAEAWGFPDPGTHYLAPPELDPEPMGMSAIDPPGSPFARYV